MKPSKVKKAAIAVCNQGKKTVCLPGDVVKNMIFSFRPSGCSGVEAFKWDYLEKQILTKYTTSDRSTASVRREKALEKMMESEEQCKAINEDGYRKSYPHLEAVLQKAQFFISELLGDFSFDVYKQSSFSSGASTSRKRAQGHPYYKYHNKLPTDVTPLAYNRAYALITATPLWCAYGGWHNLKLIAGNSITTVPKNNLIDRAIAKEPDLNMHMQRAFGTYIRTRLKTVGINLNDQTRNQELSRIGSLTDSLCTIDLSSASDSISTRLVWDLLPPEWFRELDILRSHYGVIRKGTKPIKWEKFSSMGNGFTFELESLIFWALTKATQEVTTVLDDSVSCSFPHAISVYGDDIICPSYMADQLIAVLHDVGFKTNIEKTFLKGPFRESCGEHHYKGISVTPFYIRGPIDTISRVIWLLNRLRLWSATSSGICDPTVYPLWVQLRRKYVPPEFLGGRDINAIDSVYSPEAPRMRLLNVVHMRKVGGWRSLLASLQGKSDSLNNEVSISHKYGHVVDGDPCFLPTVIMTEWRVKGNLTPPWVPIDYYFPKEL